MTLILQGVPPLGSVKQGWGGVGKASYFELNASISRKRQRYASKVTIDDGLIGSCIFDRHQHRSDYIGSEAAIFSGSMTLDDLELLYRGKWSKTGPLP